MLIDVANLLIFVLFAKEKNKNFIFPMQSLNFGFNHLLNMATTTHIDEKDLLIRLQGGDHAAFDAIYHEYSKLLYWRLHKMVKDPDLAEELLQELFIKVWNSREIIDTNKPILALLYLLTKQRVSSHYRKVARHAHAIDQIGYTSTEAVHTTEEHVFDKETRELLDQAIAMLPLQRRTAFTLCKIEGKSYKEVAKIMGISPFTVQNHIAKASASIKEYLYKQQTPPNADTLALLIVTVLSLSLY